jgi:hypothetical protein
MQAVANSDCSGDRTHPNARWTEIQATGNALVVLVVTCGLGKAESRVQFSAGACGSSNAQRVLREGSGSGLDSGYDLAPSGALSEH